MIYSNASQALGETPDYAFQRYIVRQPPLNVTTVAIVGGSLALVATVLVVKKYRGKKKRKKR